MNVASDVKWIKLMVGMFDGMSFKKIKKARIGGESFRDKLTAVWFELMDFAGRCNHDGAFISPREIPFTNLSDIAVMIDRDEEELRLCMSFFINEGMVSVVDDVYMLSNWSEYQNTDGLEKIREQNRLRQAKYKQKQKLLPSNVTDNVTVTLGNATDIDKEKDKDQDKEKESITETTCQAVVNLYHEKCPSFPVLRVLSDARKRDIRNRLKKYTLDDFEELFTRAEASDFLKGKQGDWRATFDWLIKEDNMAKVLNGNFDNRNRKATKTENSSLDMAGYEKMINRMPVYKPKTAAEDDGIRARAEALQRQIAGNG